MLVDVRFTAKNSYSRGWLKFQYGYSFALSSTPALEARPIHPRDPR